uniref:Phorbol-ester/DAG-type domain-containing protein n=1 Tax=Panagrolaimus superbus TaxID=310955 RepID=A0A914YTV9_9BILA
MFVQKTTNDIFSKIFCDNCVDENNREHCRATHRHDFVELDRFKCIKCQKECHRLCRESFAENTCKTCQPIPFRFNAAPLSESSPSTSAQSSSSSTAPATLIEINTVILKQNNCFTKVLGQKKFKFSKPDLLQKAIEYVKMLRLEQKLGEDEAMNQYYFNLSNCNLKIYGLFHAHEEGDLLMAIAFVEEVGPRCLIEVLAFQATISSIKNVIKKEIITSFFVELVKIQRNLNEFVHIRVAEGVRGYSGEIFENISNQLPKINIAVKKLKDSLVNTSSLFQIPCFSNDPKFLQIINVIHELGFKINGKLPKLRSHLSLEAAAKNYIAQLTNEIVVNGLTKKMIAKSDSAKENGSEEKSLSILSINDLLQAMEEMHLKFSDIQNCCYSTFKIVGLFFGKSKIRIIITKSKKC